MTVKVLGAIEYRDVSGITEGGHWPIERPRLHTAMLQRCPKGKVKGETMAR